jgi:hydroxymethylpyrimidine/phosphomethylpyrimidine kinase
VVPTVLTIAGSDSSGGAGIQADLKAISAGGGYGASVITAVTAQNTRGVQDAVDLAPEIVRAQLAAVFDDLDVAAVKTGMLSSAVLVELVAAELAERRPPHVVVDPVMISKTGFPLLKDDAVEAVTDKLLPVATLLTPNVHEAQRLAGFEVRSVADAERAGHRLLALGARAALVKGGHLEGAPATDVLVTEEGTRVIEGRWVDTGHTHGTGCLYSAAIATRLALGLGLEGAIRSAKEYLTEAIRAGFPVGAGVSPPDPFFAMRAARRPGGRS